MGIFSKLFWVFVVAVPSSGFAEDIKIVKLRDKESIQAEYCRVETGGHSTDCGMPYYTTKLDVLYAPVSMGKRIESHLQDSFKKGYYFNLNKKDLFHGHFFARGPQTSYASAKAYFDDVQVSLYHSQEYLHSWKEIPLESSAFVDHPQQRSFVGKFVGGEENVTAAIDLIRRDFPAETYTKYFLRGYKSAGTIYSNEVNESQNYSLHTYKAFGGDEDLFVNTCDASETPCEPCRIFTTFIMEQADGRFQSPDGVRFDVTVHCRYDKK